MIQRMYEIGGNCSSGPGSSSGLEDWRKMESYSNSPVVMVMVFTRARAGVENGVRCRGQRKGRYHGYN